MRTKLIITAASLGLMVLGWMLTLGGQTTAKIEITAYFTYPGITRVEDDNPERLVILPNIQALGKGDRLDIAMFSLTDDDIRDEIIKAHDRGVRVRIYLEKQNACGSGADTTGYLAVGIPVRVDNQSGYMHHKFAVMGAEIVITGSYNWTASADERNWENLLVIQSSEIAADYEANFEVMWEKDNDPDFKGCD